MEFAGLGTISYDTPSEEVRPFMRKKITGWVNTWRHNKNGIFYKSDIENDVEEYAKTLPEELREKAIKERTEVYMWSTMCGKQGESIKYEDVIEIWMSRIYAPPDERRRNMEKAMKSLAIIFDYMDLNKDGFVDFEEFRKAFQKLREDTIKVGFDALDANKDGLISLGEYMFAISSYLFRAETDSPYKHVFNL